MRPSAPRRLAAWLSPVLAVVVLAGCGSAGSSPGAPGAVGVVATTTQLGDVVRAVSGRDARVAQLLRPNTDPHEYEPRPDDVRAIARARVVFASGAGLDGWVGKLIKQSGGHPRVVTLADARVARLSDDPHWWHDPRNVEAAVPAIARALATADRRHARAFARRARAYLAQLRALDRRIAACVARVPPAERRLVTDHDAFGYFARRYGIRVVGAVIPSQATQAQPSAGDVARLVELIRRERVKAVFPESSVSPKLAHAIAREAGATSDATLYGDTLGPPGSAGATYLAMERHNADAMVRGFSGRRVRC